MSANSSSLIRDVFISHASEDKQAVAQPLAAALINRGYTAWISDHELMLGDVLALKIDEGLRACRFGVVVLSPAFFAKQWPQQELASLLAREEAEKRRIVLPVWHGLDHAGIASYSPILASRVGEPWTGDGSRVLEAIVRAVGAPRAVPEPAVAPSFLPNAFVPGFDLGPPQEALVAAAGRATTAVGAIWAKVKASNATFPMGASDQRKRAHSAMLAQSLSGPLARFSMEVADVRRCTGAYLQTQRRLLEAIDALPAGTVDSTLLLSLSETSGGPVAGTFSTFSRLATEKRVQAITFPRKHPPLKATLERVAGELGHLAESCDAIVDFCLSELPSRISRILERTSPTD